MFKDYFQENVRENFNTIYKKILIDPTTFFESEEKNYIAKLIKEHPSYIKYWEDDGIDPFEWDESNINPFQHILMHLIAENLLKNDSDLLPHVKAFYSKRKRKFMKHHDIIHMLAQIIANNFFKVMRGEGKFEKESFISDLEKYSSWNKKKFWNTFAPKENEEN